MPEPITEPIQEMQQAEAANAGLDAASLRHLTNVFDQDFESSNRHRWKTKPAQQPSRAQILYHHFFRRFFDNDTLSVAGETETTVIRALCTCAVPSFMFAFWLSPHYPGAPPRPYWTIEADRYFFVLYSFVVMGAVATFEWEMLFPDRADFLILLPIPLKARELFYAKGRALLAFLGMFLVACNLFATIVYPALSTRSHQSFLYSVSAHFAAVSLAGIFSAFTMLSVEGLMLCLLPSRWFRSISTAMQSLSITILLLLFLLYPLVSGHLSLLMSGNAGFAKYIPPLWFLGFYENLIYGSSAPAGASALGIVGLYATAAVILLSLFTYPLAWARQKKRAIEGIPLTRTQSRSRLATLLHKTLLRRPQQRAIFHFLGQTIARDPRYQTFLALYSGAGLALALCSLVTLRQSPDHTLVLALSVPGLHAALPLLLAWIALGLRASFAFPVDMRARWVFPINLLLTTKPNSLHPGVYPGPDAKAAKIWILLSCGALVAITLLALAALQGSLHALWIQAACGACLLTLLADLFFVGRTQIPFTRPRLPGRSGLPLAFLLYAAFLPSIVLFTVELEFAIEKHALLVIRLLAATALLHLLLKFADRLAQRGIIGGFPEDETDGGPQTLGLIQ